jgi:hypothetical protein
MTNTDPTISPNTPEKTTRPKAHASPFFSFETSDDDEQDPLTNTDTPPPPLDNPKTTDLSTGDPTATGSPVTDSRPPSPSSPFHSPDSHNPSDSEIEDPFDNTVPTAMPPTSPSDIIKADDPLDNTALATRPPASPSNKITPILPLITYYTFDRDADLTIFLVKTDNPYRTHIKLQSALGLGSISLRIISNPADIFRFNLSARMGWSKEGPGELAKLIPFLSRAEMISLGRRLQMTRVGTPKNMDITTKANKLMPNTVSNYTAFSIKADKRDKLSAFLNSTKRNVTLTN